MDFYGQYVYEFVYVGPNNNQNKKSGLEACIGPKSFNLYII